MLKKLKKIGIKLINKNNYIFIKKENYEKKLNK